MCWQSQCDGPRPRFRSASSVLCEKHSGGPWWGRVIEHSHNYSSPPVFAFCCFSYLQTTVAWKIIECEQFIKFKLCAILSSVMKSHTVLFCPAQMGIVPFPPYPCCIRYSPVSHSGAFWVIRSTVQHHVFVFKWPLFYLILTPKGSLNIPKRSCSAF
jgi:hypothetical protein